MMCRRSPSGFVGASLIVSVFLGFAANLTAAEVTTTKKYALLVGVKEYDHPKLKSLKYTENDASELAAVLRTAGYQVVLLTTSGGQKADNAKPTLVNIEKNLEVILKKCKKGDTVLVGLAGHGLKFDKIEDNFFCPEDAVPINDDEGRKTLLSLKSVFDKMERSAGAVKLLLVDACRNDPTPGRSADGPAVKPPAGVAALFSCSEGERAYELDNYRHGLFFYHVLEAMRGKAKNSDDEVTWDSLQAYVRRKVALDAPKLLDGHQQTPSLNAGELRGEPPVLIGRTVRIATRAQLSVAFGPLDRITAERAGLRQQLQPQVLFVIPGGGADLMGLHRGDVIKRVNGRDVATVSETVNAIKEMKLGDRVELDVWRDKETLKLVGRYETPITTAEELRRVRDMAQQDDPAAHYYLGFMYANGIGVLKNEAEAAQWLRKAADGHASAAEMLANLYANGRGVPKDDTEAQKWYNRAADLGSAAAQASLGFRCHNGQGVTKNDTEALKWYRKAADQGDSGSQNWLGLIYASGWGVAKDEVEAVKWYQKAAEKGEMFAQHNLGWMYANGHGGLRKDDVEAMRWFRKSADQGHTGAQNWVGVLYDNGRGVAKDEAEAVKWYRKAAEKGERFAQNNLGLKYANGQGVAKDEAEAVKWYRLSAEQGHADGQTNLGFMYETGHGVAKDEAEAVKWYRKAAEQGNQFGQRNLGLMLEYGRGVTKDPVEAVKWFRKSAAQGNHDAEANIGYMYENGSGVAKDLTEAVKWYRLSAVGGNAIGQFDLGLCYENGRGVKKNLAEALKWYRKSAAQGYAEAEKAIKRLNTAA